MVPGGLDIVHDVAWGPSGEWFASAHGGAWRANGHHKIEATGGCGVCVWKADGTLIKGDEGMAAVRNASQMAEFYSQRAAAFDSRTTREKPVVDTNTNPWDR